MIINLSYSTNDLNDYIIDFASFIAYSQDYLKYNYFLIYLTYSITY